MRTDIHELIHLKEQLNQKMQECYDIALKIDKAIDEMVKDNGE